MHLQPEKADTGHVRTALFLAVSFMILGTGSELYLLDHFEDVQQVIPLLVIGFSLVILVLFTFWRNDIFQKAFVALMGLSALSGIYGTYLHLRANYEFELEMKPSLGGWDLFTESLSGALPALAPGSMIVFALLGYSYIKLLTIKQ